MKSMLRLLAIVLMLSLCGCSRVGSTAAAVETLKGWSFQHNEGTNDYSVFFALLAKSDQYVSAEVDVDVRIVNDDGAEVYRATHSVVKDDFDYYTSQVAGEQYLANLRIPASEIMPGTAPSGKVYLTVYKEDYLRFDEVNCSAFYCLPLLDVHLVAEGLPAELDVKGFDGRVESKIKIDEISCLYDSNLAPGLEITITGTKTYGTASSPYDMINYKLYDSKDYLITSGTVFLNALSVGDKFKDNSIVVYDVVPGETYTIRFSEYT